MPSLGLHDLYNLHHAIIRIRIMAGAEAIMFIAQVT
jgi:hypothetical protein